MFKINIAEKSGKTYKLEIESEALIDKALSDKISGREISPDLEGYEFEITGASDNSGFPALKDVEGFQRKKVLLGYGKAMKKRPKREGKKKQTTPTPKGLRLRKNVRGKIISQDIVQINLKVLKEGSKKLSDIFPDQNKLKEQPASEPTSDNQTKPIETPSEISNEEVTDNKPDSVEAEGKKEAETKPDEKENE